MIFMNTLIISTFSCTFEEFEKEITENFFGCLVKDYVSEYEFVKVNDHKAHTFSISPIWIKVEHH